jgi:hypothetical protein
VSASVDLTQEQLLTLSQAARRFPPYRRRPEDQGGGMAAVNSSTVWRWCRQGAKVPGTGERVRLECVRLAGRWLTSVEAISRFIARQTPPSEPLPLPRTPAQRARASERSASALDRIGI